jgi:hypothetical protein
MRVAAAAAVQDSRMLGLVCRTGQQQERAQRRGGVLAMQFCQKTGRK